MGLADGALGRGDLVGLLAELGRVGAIGVGVAGIDLGEPVGDLAGDRLGGGRVVEDVLVGRLLRRVQQRVRIDVRDVGMVGQHIVDPVVVAAAVVDDQRRIGDLGRVGRAGLKRVRVVDGAGHDRLHRRVAAGDGAGHAAPDVRGGDDGRGGVVMLVRVCGLLGARGHARDQSHAQCHADRRLDRTHAYSLIQNENRFQ